MKVAVVIPALAASREDFDRLLAQLELHYLSCPDPSLAFVLLTDHVDALQIISDSSQEGRQDTELGLARACHPSVDCSGANSCRRRIPVEPGWRTASLDVPPDLAGLL